MNIDQNEPSRPNPEMSKAHFGNLEGYPGISIRAEIASRIMAGFAADRELNSPRIRHSTEQNHERLAQSAVNWADALITELNKPTL
tara:strand:+ start:456 stop:713 length:258 start_codon:yes stop_codon:yes gene_type:complete